MLIGGLTGQQWASLSRRILFSAPIAGTLLTAPLTRVRIVLQSEPCLLKHKKITRSYFGIFDCVSRLIRTEGALGLWTGTFAFFLTRIIPMLAPNIIPDVGYLLPSARRKSSFI